MVHRVFYHKSAVKPTTEQESKHKTTCDIIIVTLHWEMSFVLLDRIKVIIGW